MNGTQADLPKDADEVIGALKGVAGFLAAGATGLPCGTFFTDSAPPDFAPISLVTSGLVPAVLLCSYFNAPDRKRIPGRVCLCFFLTVVLLIAYFSLLQYWTVLPPRGREGHRVQIGFHMADWSLTDGAKQLIDEGQDVQLSTPNDLMLAFGVWGGKGRVTSIWKTTSVVAAGLILVFTFLAAFSLWAYGCGILARFFSASKGS